MEVWTLVGETLEEKVGNVETILRRLLRRTPQKATIVIPPIPFCSYVSSVADDGLLARWVFPTDGMIVGIHVYAGMVADKVKPSLLIMVSTDSEGAIKHVPYTLRSTYAEMKIPITAGSRIEVKTSDPTSVGEISLGLLFEVAVTKVKKQQLVLDQIYDELEKENAGKTEGGKTE